MPAHTHHLKCGQERLGQPLAVELREGVFPLLIRMILVHFVLILGTNNTTITGLTEKEISNRELGSKLVLAARIFYAIL